MVRIVGGAENAVRSRTIDLRRPCKHHEPKFRRQIICVPKNAVRACNQGIIRLQRYEDRAIAALGDEVETVVEELTEERHPSVERSA